MTPWENFQQQMARVQDTYVAQPAKAAVDWWGDLQSFTGQADAEAEKRFPNQARDSSQKNAFRHALGAGRLAQLVGANSGIPIVEGAARGFAKLAGYGWEGLGGAQNWESQDMRHDLNANALGINQSSKTKDFGSLADRLASFAQGARKELPPDTAAPRKNYFTYTK